MLKHLYLDIQRYNFDGFCLGVLFTNRIFDDLVLGLSWRGNPKPDGVGGICQHRVRIKSDKNAYSFNALFISLKSSQVGCFIPNKNLHPLFKYWYTINTVFSM